MSTPFVNYLFKMRLSRLLVIVAILLVTVPLVTHYFLVRVDGNAADSLNLDNMEPEAARNKLRLLDLDGLNGDELKRRIDDLLRIKHSVLTELRHIEQDRAEKLKKKSSLDQLIEKLRKEAEREQGDLERLRVSISQAQMVQKELAERNNPEVLPPLRILSEVSNNYVSTSLPKSICTMGTCFDLSRCPLSSGFPVYFYQDPEPGWILDGDGFGYKTSDPETACLFVAALDFKSDSRIEDVLPYWKGDGRNHLLVDVSSFISYEKESKKSQHMKTGRAMIASATVFTNQENGLTFRKRFDISLPGFSSRTPSPELWSELAPLMPVRRQYLYSYEGSSFKLSGSKALEKLTQFLTRVNEDTTDDQVFVNVTCRPDDVFNLCGGNEDRRSILRISTFALIMVKEIANHVEINRRLYEAIQEGAIPVLLCLTDCDDAYDGLPFAEFVDYRRAIVMTSVARVTELHFLLRSLPDTDLHFMRRQGRLIWQNYLGSSHGIVTSLLNVVRQRIGLPPGPVQDSPSPSVFNATFRPLQMDQLLPDAEMSESLGPLESPTPSIAFRRNFSSMITNGYDFWNTHFFPFQMAPYTPWEPVLPTEAKFLGSSAGFRPVGGGEGGSGHEFSQAIGGNVPHEQFTVVMLTYKRELVLADSLARLHALPYLNKVVVVWNSPQPPSEDLRWPDIGVPIEVVRTSKNSLNNRFLPFDVIETEAVLSVDDDAHLRHDEIIFGFRVWRENRNRLVGFPGRFHAWDAEHNSWNYNSNYSCELSMVLTGAAFYHKFYSYAYFNLMPQAIRDKIDEYTNCEDLAMNFLVSHMTRQPPVKVTSRWTFRCPGCPVSLSEDDSHFQERHECINFFVQVYGYNPLLYTQYRADSVLFKTRIPQDKQKCFKFI